ncbi:hypothetical protein ACNRBH_17870 [Ralstonia pseudosolanacearum]|uniref:hypothetical protein n=1 Tax=Ralstonia pseudosolanacearum TaxID=1310165 RepID=UPI003AAF7349
MEQFGSSKLVLVPTAEHKRLLVQISALVRAGYQHRNLLAEEFRRTAAHAAEFINPPRDRAGNLLPRPALQIDGAASRGFIFTTCARMGRGVTAERLAAYLGSKPIHFELPTKTGKGIYLQLPVLRVLWPYDGRPASFLKNFIAAFDYATGLNFSFSVKGDRSRVGFDALPVLTGLSIGASIGLVIVERINTRVSRGTAAFNLWDLLGQFTRTSGIPVLCMATSGATANLMESDSAAGELSAGGSLQLSPLAADSQTWRELCALAYQRVTGDQRPAPEWLSEALGVVVRGRVGLVEKVCREVRRVVPRADWRQPIGNFVSLATGALFTDAPHLDTAAKLDDVRGITLSSLIRYGDWLSPGQAHVMVPGLQYQPASARIHGK